ncbi:ABC transporter ATP-binding protein [Listeria grayi]|uniref:ABC transporter ATP-binding protein n=1 Tax=Listeria grayi TaxID=1641 RepID=UPI00162788A4|nr:ABC transporter ATP-binding protein [Listeria grayi]MBC1920850.1 ABC transporter ATP-binding protein [Listeria grayi]
MEQPILQVKQISKKIGKKKIIQDISFDVHKGEVFGLLGPNGAGKTTIIRSIVGLISMSEGEVWIAGKNIKKDFKSAISNVGAIIENPEFYKFMSGWDNLKQFARMSRKKISDDELKRIVETVKLTPAIRKKVKTYSLGMRQRLGVAQALIHSPGLLILDEPTNGLDPQGMAEFRDLITQLAANGTSVLISSHLLSEIQQITQRFAIINQGIVTHIEAIASLTDENHISYLLEVTNPAITASLLEDSGIKIINQQNNQFEIELTHEQSVHLVRNLIHANVDVLEFVKIKASLEKRFLELTSTGGTEQ